jgi:hypothetical protein
MIYYREDCDCDLPKHDPDAPYCPVCHCFDLHGIRCGDGWVGEPIETPKAPFDWVAANANPN